jgi:hypothetical protein
MKTKRIQSIALLFGASCLCASSAEASIVAYYEVNGSYLPGYSGNGNLTGTTGTYSGMNISSISASNWRGVENSSFHIFSNTTGRVEHYYAYSTGGTPHYNVQASTTLTGGSLNGLASDSTSPNYLGATNDVIYFSDGTGGVIRYTELGTQTLSLDPAWTSLNGGGDLNGLGVSRGGVGLKDFGGNTDLSDNYLMYVESNGTLGYYYLDNGTYASGLNATYGSWTTFTSGELSGLTLSQLNSAATGTVGAYSYKYLGNSDDVMYFDIQSVPEPASAALSCLGLVSLFMRRRR